MTAKALAVVLLLLAPADARGSDWRTPAESG